MEENEVRMQLDAHLDVQNLLQHPDGGGFAWLRRFWWLGDG